MSSTDDETPDAETLLERLGQKLTGGDDSDESNESETGQKEEPDADQKQPPDGADPDNDEVREDLIAALAEEYNADPAEVREAVAQLAGDDMDGGDDEDDEGEDDAEQETSDGDESNEINIDFGAKMEEHGVLTEDDLDGFVTEDDLGSKLEDLQESIVDDLGQKLAETNEEAVEEIAQKMQTGTTDSPAGGSFQDEQDFDTHLEEIASGDGWVSGGAD